MRQSESYLRTIGTARKMKTKFKASDHPKFDRDIAGFSKRQIEAITLLSSGKIKYLLYGGALGGGKSFLLRWYAIKRLCYLYQIHGIKNAVGMLACEDYPSLKDRQLQKIATEIPSWFGKMHSDHRDYGRSFILHDDWGGGVIAFRNLDDPSKYASAEFAFILVDELTKNTYDVFTFLRSRLRWPGLPDIETQFIGATNPGSIGHGWVKQLWIDRSFPEEWVKPTDYRSQFAYVPSKADDNPYLDENYWNTLATLPENLRKAFRDGDWNIFVNQAFTEFSTTTHVIEPIPVPAQAPIIMTFDWGFGAPFSLQWFWVDSDNRLYLFHEWYGWNGTANQGLRLSDTDIADGIINHEQMIGLDKSRYILRLAGHDCFQKKPDYQGGGQGPSTAETFSDKGLHLVIGKPDRKLKIRAFRERIRIIENEKPKLLIYSNCKQFIRTIPNLVMDENNIEDIDTKGEDHIYDSCCLVCQARPVSMEQPKSHLNSHEARILALEQGSQLSEFERQMLHEPFSMFEQEDEIGNVMHYEDGYKSDLRSTI